MRTIIYLAASLLTIFSSQAAGQSESWSVLSLGQVTVSAEISEVMVPLNLTVGDGSGVSDASLTIEYSEKLGLKQVLAGQAAKAASKEFYFQYYVADRQVVIVVTGLNNNTMASGELAQLIFEIIDPTPGEAPINFVTATVTSPEAVSLPVETLDGLVILEKSNEETTDSNDFGPQGNEANQEAAESQKNCGGCVMRPESVNSTFVTTIILIAFGCLTKRFVKKLT